MKMLVCVHVSVCVEREKVAEGEGEGWKERQTSEGLLYVKDTVLKPGDTALNPKWQCVCVKKMISSEQRTEQGHFYTV